MLKKNYELQKEYRFSLKVATHWKGEGRDVYFRILGIGSYFEPVLFLGFGLFVKKDGK